MSSKQVFYEGRVQGVGFRYSTRQIAMGFEVTGWVRNLPDGRVELQVTGAEDEVEEFLREIRESNLGPHIKSEEVHGLASLEGVSGFSIRY